MFLELNSKGLHQSSGKEKQTCCLLFPSSTKREIRQFHVEVVQRRLKNVQKVFFRSRCHRRRRCITGSLMTRFCRYFVNTAET